MEPPALEIGGRERAVCAPASRIVARSNHTDEEGKEGEEGYKPQVGKELIPGNREYIGIAHFKPLFQCELCHE